MDSESSQSTCSAVPQADRASAQPEVVLQVSVWKMAALWFPFSAASGVVFWLFVHEAFLLLFFGLILPVWLAVVPALFGVHRTYITRDGLCHRDVLFGRMHVPWSELGGIWHYGLVYIADVTKPRWWCVPGFILPLRLFLRHPEETLGRLREFRDSRPLDAWPKAAREFFAIYCR